MINVVRLIITVVFGLLWWWIYNRVGADLHYLMILGSVLAICVCCCKGGSDPGEWNVQRYLACIRRCWIPTLVLILSLFVIGVTSPHSPLAPAEEPPVPPCESPSSRLD